MLRKTIEETTIFATDPMLFFTFDKYTHNIFLHFTAKEHLCSQQYPQGSRQWYQEEEAYQVRFIQGNGPKVP